MLCTLDDFEDADKKRTLFPVCVGSAVARRALELGLRGALEGNKKSCV